MKHMINIILLHCLVLTYGSTRAQYFGERVMEKSFEQTDFFFTPYRFVPYGIGTFKNSVAGVLDDPLLDLDVNPSYLYRDSVRTSYLHLDFRSAREIRDERNFYFPYPIFAVRAEDARSYIPYPRFYINTRRELEPVVSAAYLFRPAKGALRNLSFGLTYQMISQDEKYYPIPQDIYKTTVGYDYLGVRSAAAEGIPIVDKYSGTDHINQRGHFVSLFTGYELEPGLQVGVKLGRVNFERDGSVGSQNLWESYYSTDYTSLWRNVESRNQAYKHWELIGGINYTVAGNYSISVHGGALWGDADQVLARGDSSYYGYGPIGSTTQNWSEYARSGNQRQTWGHDGRTSLGGINLRAQVNESQKVQVHYQYARQNTDISLAGLIVDTSYGMSRYRWDTTLYLHSSTSRLLDSRSGTGNTVGTIHRIVGSLQWDINERVRVSFGAQVEHRSSETATSEAVLADRFSRYSTTGSYQYSYFDSTAESKTLQWDFRTKLTRFAIPVFFTIKASEYVELLFGLNRSVSNWEVDDVTLAIFDYRVRANQQGMSRKERFGERYTQPRETVSDIKTTLLAGLTVSPSRTFNMRFLVVPNFIDTYTGSELSDLQWWIAVNLLP